MTDRWGADKRRGVRPRGGQGSGGSHGGHGGQEDRASGREGAGGGGYSQVVRVPSMRVS